MASGLRPEGPGSILSTAKDSPSTCGVRDRKTSGSESPMVGRQQFTTGIVSAENLPPFQRHIRIVEMEMVSAAIFHTEAEIGLLPLKNGPLISGVTYPLCLKHNTGLGLPSGTRQQQQQVSVVLIQKTQIKSQMAYLKF